MGNILQNTVNDPYENLNDEDFANWLKDFKVC